MWQSDIRFKKLKLGRWIVAATIIAVVYFTISGPQGYLALRSAQKGISQLHVEIKQAQVTIDSLKQYIEALHSDTFAIEQAARYRLGMAKKDELIYKFIDSPSR